MRQLPHSKAKDFDFCFKCNQSHEFPVCTFCQVVGQNSGNSVAETDSNSSTSSIPHPSRPKPLPHSPSSGLPDKLDAILQHLKHLVEGIKEVKKSLQQGQMGESGHLSSPPRQGYVPPHLRFPRSRYRGQVGTFGHQTHRQQRKWWRTWFYL